MTPATLVNGITQCSMLVPGFRFWRKLQKLCGSKLSKTGLLLRSESGRFVQILICITTTLPWWHPYSLFLLQKPKAFSLWIISIPLLLQCTHGPPSHGFKAYELPVLSELGTPQNQFRPKTQFPTATWIEDRSPFFGMWPLHSAFSHGQIHIYHVQIP